ncbi:MAG: glycosyltransferase family 4 protein [Planctomycetia bacterium]|nr:glycosyltransferase family 4 protein [Planctomycetia bacterium]
MKIGLVLDWYDPRRGGVEQWTHQFAAQLIAARHEVHVVARRFALAAAPAGMICHEVSAGNSRLEFAAAAESALRRLNLDVVHETGCGWHADVFQPHGGSRVAAFERNLELLPAWQRPWKRRLAQWLPRYREFGALAARQFAADGRHFLALSEMVAEDLRRFHQTPPESTKIIYNGVDTERFSPARREEYRSTVRERLGVEDAVLLLIVAHNFRLKGVPALMMAAAQLVRAGLPVHVAVAGGKRSGGYVRWARSLGIAAQTTFLGSIDDVVPYYAAADIYVQPTFYDPCSLVVLEALSAGLPVVTTRWNGAGELITNNLEGHVLDQPDDADALASTLVPLVLSESRREAMGRAARQLALAHTLERNCQEIVGVYEEVVAARGPRRRQAA